MSIEYLRRFGPDVPPVNRLFQMYEVGPWDTVDTNGDGEIDVERDPRSGAQGLRNDADQRGGAEPRPSWSLNVADNVKDQHTDQFTLNLERELIHNLSLSATYVYKHTTDMFVNIPINRETGQEWEYERIPFTTSSGQTVQLYSVVLKDYNGDGVVDNNDIQWITDNGTYRTQNMPNYRRRQAQARLPRPATRPAQEVLRPLAGPGLLRVLELLGHGPPLPAAGRQRRGPDVLGRQLDEHLQPDRQQHGRPVAFHAQVRVQAVRLLHDPQAGDRLRRAVPVAHGPGRCSSSRAIPSARSGGGRRTA